MSTDRELLELAAKAAGIALRGVCDTHALIDGTATQLGLWNPLTDDGDALRLAVKLRLSIDYAPHDVGPYVRAWRPGVEMLYAPVSELEDFHAADGDPYAATRRAIVRAAAAIGREAA